MATSGNGKGSLASTVPVRMVLILPDSLVAFDPHFGDLMRLGEHDDEGDSPHLHYHVVEIVNGKIDGADLGYHSVREAASIVKSSNPEALLIMPSGDLLP